MSPPTVLNSSKVHLRYSLPSDGPLLYRLYLDSGKSPLEGIDWTGDVGGYWIVAEVDGVAMGCIQVCPSLPIARVELLCVPVDVPYRLKARLVSKLTDMAKVVCRKLGAQAISYVFHPTRYKDWPRIAQRRGAVKWASGDMYLMKV